jgi:hypothetical protein
VWTDLQLVCFISNSTAGYFPKSGFRIPAWFLHSLQTLLARSHPNPGREEVQEDPQQESPRRFSATKVKPLICVEDPSVVSETLVVEVALNACRDRFKSGILVP